jgi:hypothetical protein
MAKKSGLGSRMWVGGYDLSNDTGSINSMGSPRGVFELTGMDKEAFERILTTKDGQIDWSSWFNPAANQSHEVYSALPTASQLITFAQADDIGAVSCSLMGKQINYDGTRNQDGSFSFGLNAQATDWGLEWGLLGTAGVRTDGSATNGAALESPTGASTAFGLQAYCHLLAFTGTSVTIKLQGDDNSGFTSATDVTGGSFGALTTPRTGHRIATANNATIERYLRVVTTGTFSNAVFVVQISRNDHANVVF